MGSTDKAIPKGCRGFHDIYERDEVAEWTHKAHGGRSGLSSPEKMGPEEEDTLSGERTSIVV